MIRTKMIALLAVVPAAALAQVGALDAAKGARETSRAGNARVEQAADAAAKEPAAAPGDDGALEIAPPEASATAADQGRGTVPPPDTYTVRPGDTLWDLSGRFLNNPWYWPKVWSYNPEIANPHWISPGNVLRFYPATEDAPAHVEAVAAAPEPEPEEAAPPRELEDFSRADLKAPEPLEEQDAVAVAGPYKIGFVPARSLLARHDTFVTQRELDESGAIAAAFEEKIMLASLDRAYARFKHGTPVKAGETYVIYKTERPIYHPVTKELFGYQSVVLGSAKVVAVDDKAATLVIASTFEPIERGALLGPWTEKLVRPVTRRPNERALSGRIIASQVDVVTEIGEHHVVFIDRGRADGVQEGNVFKVVRSGDLYGRPPDEVPNDPSLPKEDVGDLLVVDTKDHASTALVTRSLHELTIGDRIEMRPTAGSGGN